MTEGLTEEESQRVSQSPYGQGITQGGIVVATDMVNALNSIALSGELEENLLSGWLAAIEFLAGATAGMDAQLEMIQGGYTRQ